MKKQLLLKINESLHTQLKTEAAEKKTTITQIIVTILERRIKRKKTT